MARSTDVLIVGASFAGIAVAYSAPPEKRTLLIDRKTFPNTPSTGLITKTTLDLMSSVFPFEIPLAKHYNDMKLIFKGIGEVELHSDEPFMYLLDKEAFFQKALSNLPANVEFIPRCTFTGLASDWAVLSCFQDRIEVKFETLIGADGAFSRVARSSGLGTVGSWLYGYEWDCYAQNVRDITFIIDPAIARGYGVWAFDNGSTLSVGCAAENALKRGQLALISQEMLDTDCEPVKPRGGAIPVSGPVNKRCIDRILLVGDAAGFCGPFLGDGIQTAVLSAQCAANALASKGSICRVYEEELKAKQVHQYLNQQLKLRRMWKHISGSQQASRLLMFVIRKNKDNMLQQLNLLKASPGALGHVLLEMISAMFK